MTVKEDKNLASAQSKPELNSYLRTLREKKGLEPGRLADILGISEKILQSLERGQPDQLPPDSYLRGILKKYARYFKLDYRELHGFFLEQFPNRFSGRTDTLPGNRFISSARNLRLLAGPSFGSWLLIVLFAYLLAQLIYLVLPIRITLRENYALAQTSPLMLQGRLRGNVKAFYVNGQRVNLQGKSFSSPLFLNPGPNSVELVAENYLGRKTITRKIIALNIMLPSPTPEINTSFIESFPSPSIEGFLEIPSTSSNF